MAKNSNLTDFLTGIADKLREITGTYDKINPQDFESMIQEVCDVKTGDEDFWDEYQQNGKRTDYYCAFSGPGWNENNFKPKYDIIIDGNGMSSPVYLFDRCPIKGSLKEILEKQGVKLKFQNLGNAGCMEKFCYNNWITELPEIDFSSITSGTLSIYVIGELPNLETIEKVIFPAADDVGYGDIFGNCRKLRNIDFGYPIKHSLDFHLSPLSADSMFNLFMSLEADFLSTETEYEERSITVKTSTEEEYRAEFDEYNTSGDDDFPFYSYSWDYQVMSYTTYGNWTISVI